MISIRLAVLSAIAALVLAAPASAQPRLGGAEMVQSISQAVQAEAMARAGAGGMRLAATKIRVDKHYEVPKAPRKTEGPAQDSRDQTRRSSSSSSSSSGPRCTSCRSACSRRWRANCGTTSSCKSSYAGCMRECWKDSCRA
jgi:hypothetical protein